MRWRHFRWSTSVARVTGSKIHRQLVLKVAKLASLSLSDAEAEGALRKAEAFAKLDDSSRALLVLERFPEIIKAFAPVAAAVAAPLGNIDKLVMIDSGGSGDGNGTVNRLASTVPTTMFQVMQAAQALGLDMSVLLGKLGIKAEEETETKGGKKG